MTPEELARRCLQEQGSYDKARWMASKVYVPDDVREEALNILTRWENERG
jgi:hypothetical protein